MKIFSIEFSPLVVNFWGKCAFSKKEITFTILSFLHIFSFYHFLHISTHSRHWNLFMLESGAHLDRSQSVGLSQEGIRSTESRLAS